MTSKHLYPILTLPLHLRHPLFYPQITSLLHLLLHLPHLLLIHSLIVTHLQCHCLLLLLTIPFEGNIVISSRSEILGEQVQLLLQTDHFTILLPNNSKCFLQLILMILELMTQLRSVEVLLSIRLVYFILISTQSYHQLIVDRC